MKKILSIALVALLAASAFAGFKGSANVGFGFKTDSKEWGFMNQTNGIDFDVELASGSVKKGEGELYAGIEAEFALKWDTEKPANPFVDGGVKKAYITDGNWELSILGTNDLINYATSAIDTDATGKKFYDYKNTFPKTKLPGLAFSMADYKASFGLVGKGTDEVATSVTFETPNYTLAEGFTLGVGANYAYDNRTASAINAFGASVKTAYENDTFSLAVASDLGYDIKAEKFGADVAAKFSVSPVVVDFYYATLANYKESTEPDVKNLLSAQVSTDLRAFNVPLQLTVAGKDLINEQNLSAEVVVPVAPVEITVNGGYGIQKEEWNAGASVKYTHDMFVAGAGVSVSGKVGDDNVHLGANASISSTALVPGATLALEWKDISATEKIDLLNNHYGQVVASCKIEF